ncbi:MAG: HepT-like ribonuclease domain-containing protein, partial [Microcystis sp.]
VHKYDQLDLDVVWDIVENKLTELLKAIAPLL